MRERTTHSGEFWWEMCMGRNELDDLAIDGRTLKLCSLQVMKAYGGVRYSSIHS
jgi:hypothetical protein